MPFTASRKPVGPPEPAAPPALDIGGNRSARKWSRRELAARALWELLRGPLFAWTPRPMWGWRRTVLRLFGARVGPEAHIYPTARIAIPWNLRVGAHAAIGDHAIVYNLGMVSIGREATISPYAHLCAGTHDHRRADLPLVKAEIEVGEGAWICAGAFVGPGVRIGRMSIVGARAAVFKDAPEGVILGGNPARVLRPRPPVERP